MEVAYLLLIGLFFVLMIGFAAGCARLGGVK